MQGAHRNKQEGVKSEDSKKGCARVYLNILEQAPFFDPEAICGLLFVYAAPVPMVLTSITSCGKLSRWPAAVILAKRALRFNADKSSAPK